MTLSLDPPPSSGAAVPPASPPAEPEQQGLRGWMQRAHRRHRARGQQDLLFLGMAGSWIAFDQITKVILRAALERGDHWEITSFLQISHVLNEGAAFGFFGDANGVLAVSAAVAIVVVTLYYLFPPIDHWLARLGLALILGGAVGNVLDRIYQGSVTDFVDFAHFPAFNVADAGINIGVVAIILALLISDARRSGRPR